jgi:pyruvate dehydrogenase E2 component (dihydrolipoamide acetyltransferase)
MAPIKNFPLPDVGEGLTEAEILTWHVGPGDTVTVNQIFVEIETAKAAVELPCPYAGVVTELFAEVGATVQVGTPLIAIDLDPTAAAGSEPAAGGAGNPEGRIPTLVGYGPRVGAATRRRRKQPSAPPAAPPAAAAAPAAPAATPPPAAPPPPPPAVVPAPQEPEHAAAGLVPLAKPPVRKLAKELGIDLRSLSGSGADGVITREDVAQAAHSASNGAAPAGSAPVESLPVESLPAEEGRERGERREPIRGVRKATAAAMVSSAFTAPHVTEFLTVDVTPMMEFRGRLKGLPRYRDVKVTPLAFAARAMCLAARRTPAVNARWDEEAGDIVYFDYVHLGIAAATPRGLVVPKIRDADRMSLQEIAVALEELTTTARAGRTPPGDMTGGTITITNVGVFGVDTGTPILNPGESAILAFGAIRDMPWVVDGAVVPRKVCQLALSFDHRVVDGQQGSEFLADVGALLADPALAFTY